MPNRNTPAHMVTSVFSNLFQLFYPSTCTVCNGSLRYSEKIMCSSCLLDIPRVHIHNKQHNPLEELLWGQIPYVRASSFFNYTKKNPYSALIHNLKYKKQEDTGILVGEIFGLELLDSGFLDGIDAIVPIPLHLKRQTERGFNQSEVIAQGIARVTNIEIITDSVVRTVNTKTQTLKSKEERTKNVAQIFEITKAEKLQNKHILLLDDVITTGATCISCADTIIQNTIDCKISVASVGIAKY